MSIEACYVATYVKAMGQSVSDPAKYHRSDGGGLDVVTEPDPLRLADYWRAKRNGRAMPRREDIDPVDIPWALSRLYLVDYDRELETYRYRVAGAEIENVFAKTSQRRSMRGATIEEALPPGVARLLRKRWRPLVEEGAIIYMRGLIYVAVDRVPIGTRLLLPLGNSDDDSVTGLIGLTDFEWQSRTEAESDPQLDIWYIPLDEID